MNVIYRVLSSFRRVGFLGTAATLWVVAAIGFFGVHYFPPLSIVALLFSPPGFFVLGADEVTERYGPLLEAFYFWLLGLPCALIYAFFILRFRRHEKAP